MTKAPKCILSPCFTFTHPLLAAFLTDLCCSFFFFCDALSPGSLITYLSPSSSPLEVSAFPPQPPTASDLVAMAPLQRRCGTRTPLLSFPSSPALKFLFQFVSSSACSLRLRLTSPLSFVSACVFRLSIWEQKEPPKLLQMLTDSGECHFEKTMEMFK